ncbi:hypothetical protein J056_001893 [Wallemia ichthyophaga EXF-994]|uniref:Uncharacterized protein n=1 Tax=Wallemia ichthyophaga (strain EXF-994 / CBS 113033) TaxID=1299270 RepID=R9AB42_WALI9|nr:uncharacterized protein J056_001893 [Wallemia ichthyophaga EXF-994]EOQ99337.1 hypothetical protein J056_001893 [Wallemia ichthyophaga EXF-994]
MATDADLLSSVDFSVLENAPTLPTHSSEYTDPLILDSVDSLNINLDGLDHSLFAPPPAETQIRNKSFFSVDSGHIPTSIGSLPRFRKNADVEADPSSHHNQQIGGMGDSLLSSQFRFYTSQPIVQSSRAKCLVNSVATIAGINSGSPIDSLSIQFARYAGIQYDTLFPAVQVEDSFGNVLDVVGQVSVPFQLRKIEEERLFAVINTPRSFVSLGMPFLSNHNLDIDWKCKTFSTAKAVSKEWKRRKKEERRLLAEKEHAQQAEKDADVLSHEARMRELDRMMKKRERESSLTDQILGTDRVAQSRPSAVAQIRDRDNKIRNTNETQARNKREKFRKPNNEHDIKQGKMQLNRQNIIQNIMQNNKQGPQNANKHARAHNRLFQLITNRASTPQYTRMRQQPTRPTQIGPEEGEIREAEDGEIVEGDQGDRSRSSSIEIISSTNRNRNSQSNCVNPGNRVHQSNHINRTPSNRVSQSMHVNPSPSNCVNHSKQNVQTEQNNQNNSPRTQITHNTQSTYNTHNNIQDNSHDGSMVIDLTLDESDEDANNEKEEQLVVQTLQW